MTKRIGSMVSGCTVCVALAVAPALAGDTIPSHGDLALLDTSGDVIVDRAFVPSERRPQGEVRVVRRGERVVVQTLLYTRVPNRVFAAIGDKERQNWPVPAPEHADMESYLAALEELRRVAVAREGATETDRRLRVLIEFVDASDETCVALGAVDLEEQGGVVGIRTRDEPALLRLSAEYVRRNMRFIVADAFRVSMEEADALLSRTPVSRAVSR